MLEKYKDSQKLFYNYINHCFVNDKISHAYLIELNGVKYGYDLALDLAKFFLCNGSYDEKKCNMIDNGLYSNFFLIDSESVIKKENILELQRRFSFKSVDNNKKVYFIKDASLLNDSSANSLLKFLEEPIDDTIAILLTNNINDVKETIVSRCQVINLVNNDKFDYKSLFNYILNDEISNVDELIDNEYKKYLDFFNSLETNGYLVLKNKNIYDMSINIDSLFKFGIYLYFDLINVILNNCKGSFLPDSDIKDNILIKNDLKTLTKKVSILNKYVILNKYNINKNLFLDNFIIMFGGVK